MVMYGYGIQVRYRKDPHMQNSMCKLKLILTLTLTLTDTGGAIYFIMISYTKYISNKKQTSKKAYIYIIQPTLYNIY